MNVSCKIETIRQSVAGRLAAAGVARLFAAALICLGTGVAAGEVLRPAHAEDAVAKAQEDNATVVIDNFTFAPESLTVSAGTTVTWVNHDDIPHVVAEKDLKFKSKALDTDDKFSHTFETPGEFEYFCAIHPHMVGKIIVKAP
jgi:plastocyanin